MLIGRWALGALMIVFGALVNAIYLLVDPDYYVPFADQSPFSFVRGTWESLVVPNTVFFITVLIVFELVAGAWILFGGWPTQVGLIALIASHIDQLAFGGADMGMGAHHADHGALLLRAEQRSYTAQPGNDRSHRVAT